MSHTCSSSLCRLKRPQTKQNRGTSADTSSKTQWHFKASPGPGEPRWTRRDLRVATVILTQQRRQLSAGKANVGHHFSCGEQREEQRGSRMMIISGQEKAVGSCCRIHSKQADQNSSRWVESVGNSVKLPTGARDDARLQTGVEVDQPDEKSQQSGCMARSGWRGQAGGAGWGGFQTIVTP